MAEHGESAGSSAESARLEASVLALGEVVRDCIKRMTVPPSFPGGPGGLGASEYDIARAVLGASEVAPATWDVPPHWTTDDVLAEQHAHYHDQGGNMLYRDECGWECSFWEVGTFLAEARLIPGRPSNPPAPLTPEEGDR